MLMGNGEYRDPTFDRVASVIDVPRELPTARLEKRGSSFNGERVKQFMGNQENLSLLCTLYHLEDLDGYDEELAAKEESSVTTREQIRAINEEIAERKEATGKKVDRSPEAVKAKKRKEKLESTLLKKEMEIIPVLDGLEISPAMINAVTRIPDRQENKAKVYNREKDFSETEMLGGALENALLVLNELDAVFGKDSGIDLALKKSSRGDDIFNGVDIVGEIVIDGKPIHFYIDVTASMDTAKLEYKFCNRDEPQDWPQEMVENAGGKPETPTKFLLGFSPDNAVSIIKGAGIGLNIDTQLQKGAPMDEVAKDFGKLGIREYRHWIVKELRLQTGNHIMNCQDDDRFNDLINLYDYFCEAEKRTFKNTRAENPDWVNDPVYRFIKGKCPNNNDLKKFIEQRWLIKQ